MNKEKPTSEARPTTALSGDAAEGFLNRMRELFKDKLTGLDELQRLHSAAEKDPDLHKEEFDLFLDDLAYEALTDNDQFMGNIAKIRSGKASPEEQQCIKQEQNDSLRQYKAIILDISGLPQAAGMDDFEVSREKIHQLLAEQNADSATQGDVLRALGMLTVDEEGVERFTYPKELFPSSTNKKWETCLESVRRHVKIARDLQAGVISSDRSAVEDADKVRRYAHNSVSRDFDSILGLSELPDSQWNFENTRSLVAKMRELRFPTVETAEGERTEESVSDALKAIGVLATNLSDLKR